MNRLIPLLIAILCIQFFAFHHISAQHPHTNLNAALNALNTNAPPAHGGGHPTHNFVPLQNTAAGMVRQPPTLTLVHNGVETAAPLPTVATAAQPAQGTVLSTQPAGPILPQQPPPNTAPPTPPVPTPLAATTPPTTAQTPPSTTMLPTPAFDEAKYQECAAQQLFAFVSYSAATSGDNRATCQDCKFIFDTFSAEKINLFADTSPHQLNTPCQDAKADCTLAWPSLQVLGTCGMPVNKNKAHIVENWVKFYDAQFADTRVHDQYQHQCGIMMPGCRHTNVFKCENNRCKEVFEPIVHMELV